MATVFTTWGVGALQGFTHKENVVPTSVKYTTMSVATGLSLIKAIPQVKKPIDLGGALIAIPLLIGSVFCLGTQMGKATRSVYDTKLN